MTVTTRTSILYRILLLMLLFLSLSSMLYAFGSVEEAFTITDPSEVIESYASDAMTQSYQELTVIREMYNDTVSNNEQFDATDTLILFSSGNSNNVQDRYLLHTNGIDRLYYNIYDTTVDHVVLKDLSTYNSVDDALWFSFPRRRLKRYTSLTDTEVNSYYMEIPDGQYVTAGFYTDTIDIDLYDSTSQDLLDSEVIPISVEVGEIIGLSIVDVGNTYNPEAGPYSMDFGVLETGKNLSANAIALSNTQYSITVASMNGGQLKHETFDEYAPYTLSINGSPAAISGTVPVELITNAPPTPTTGTSYLLTVTIGDIEWIPSGAYEDYLVFEITSN
jgi:spore coat protein U-like protein